MSHAALKSMRVLDPAKGRDKCDNLLVEWMLSLELLKAGRLKAIHPIVIGEIRGDGSMAALGGDNTTSSGNESGADGVAAAALLLPDAVSQKSYALLVEYAARLELTLSDTAASRTVRGTLTELLAHEGTRWWELQMGQAVMNSAAAANEARFLALVSQLVFGKAETGGSGSATAEAQSSTSETGAPSAAAVDVAAGLELMGERMSDLMQEARRSEAASRSLLRQSSATNMSKLRLQRSTSREDGLVSSRGGGGGLASPRGQAVPAIDANAAAVSGASAADEETNALVERLTEWFQTDCGIHPRDAGTFASRLSSSAARRHGTLRCCLRRMIYRSCRA